MAKLQPKVYIIGLTNGAACSQSAPQQCLEALLRSGAARPVLHHRRSALQRPSGAPTPGRRRRCSLPTCERRPQHLSTRRLAGLAAASLQAVPREAVVQATDAMRVADLGLARRRWATPRHIRAAARARQSERSTWPATTGGRSAPRVEPAGWASVPLPLSACAGGIWPLARLRLVV